MKNYSLAHILIPIAAIFTLTPWCSSGVALLLGVLIAMSLGNPYGDLTKKYAQKFLPLAVMGLGAGMNLGVVARVGLHGISYTILGIATAFLLGTLLGKILNTEKDTSLLITVGTAICGGSAIAAVAPVIRAKHQDVSVALGTVFMLNALALFLFPFIGHHLQLDQNQFGLWSALAIHDTSSVVGATIQYGPIAAQVGTTVKLARALWIIPVDMMIGFLRSRKEVHTNTEVQSSKKPWFILGFIIAAALVTWIPILIPLGHQVEGLAKKLMVLTLFLIGSSLTRQTVKSVGVKPFIQGVILWLAMASLSLTVIYYKIIN